MTSDPRPIGYEISWHSKPNWPAHSRQYVWADDLSVELGKTMWDIYGVEGAPMTPESSGQLKRVRPLWSHAERRGIKKDHIQINGIAWRAAIRLAELRQQERRDFQWLSTSDLSADIEAPPSDLPTRMKPLVAAGVVERRWTHREDKNRARELEWRWK